MTTLRCFDSKRNWLLVVVTLSAGWLAANAATARQPATEDALANQNFFCTTGYVRADCLEHVTKLKNVMLRYPTGLRGQWDWVIVRAEDWHPLMLRLGLDTRSPAFSALEQRETFLEESLFLPERVRSEELAHDFHVPVDDLLSIAVSHELGHVICHGGDEAMANRVAAQLRDRQQPECGERPKSLTQLQKTYLQSNPLMRPPWR
jgi:hypothetical protein